MSKVTIESARATLERKAKVYEKLMKGKSGGLSEKQYEALLVDVRVSFPSWCAWGDRFFSRLLFFTLRLFTGLRSDVVGSLIQRAPILTSRTVMM